MNKLLLFTLFGFLIFLVTGCNTKCDEFDQRIITSLIRDNEISESKWHELIEILENNKPDIEPCFPELYSGSQVDLKKLHEHIQIIADENPRVKNPIIFNPKPSDPFKFRFYLESSASVWPYDTPGTNGEFRAAIVDLLNSIERIEPNTTTIKIVNTGIYDFTHSVNQLITSPRLFTLVQGTGNHGWTNFHQIFDLLLSNLDDNEVAIMVSDLIYSTQQMQGKNISALATEVEGLTRNVFNRYADDIAMMVVKMNGSYNGYYYYFDPALQNERNFSYTGNRPFYFTIYTRNNTMKTFLEDDKFNTVRNFSYKSEYENQYVFQGMVKESPYYSILTRHPKTIARFSPSKIQPAKYQIVNLDNVGADNYKSIFQIAVAVDLSGFFVDEDYKLDRENYQIHSSGFEIAEIIPIDGFTSNESKSATHVLVLKATDISTLKGELKIKMKKRLPDWISQSSTRNDRNRTAPEFPHTTFLFSEMMNGIFKAYNPDADNAYYFEIAITLN